MPDLGIEELMRQARWDDAILACQAALQVQPTNSKLLAYMGMSYFRKNEWAPAAAAFHRATILEPSFWEAGTKHAQCLDRMGKYAEAYEVAQTFFRVKPGDPTLQGLIHGLERYAAANRKEGWERSVGLDTVFIETVSDRK